jgi:hypothetical protein
MRRDDASGLHRPNVTVPRRWWQAGEVERQAAMSVRRRQTPQDERAPSNFDK